MGSRLANGLLGLAALTMLLGVEAAAAEKSPFFPSAQTTPDGKVAAMSDYAKNSDCVRCHQEFGKQWKGSIHASSVTEPVFQALNKLASQQTKGLTDNLCVGCHSSPLVITGQSTPQDVAKAKPPASEGVSCVVCHSISRSNRTSPDQLPANASFVTDPKGPIVGPHSERPCKIQGRETIKSSLMRKSEFCANCHGVVHPLNGFVIERTYDEWRNSIYAAKGFQCQDCHMQPVEKAIESARTLKRVPNPGRIAESGPEHKHVYSHSFTGANSVVTTLLGAKEHAAMSEKLLKSAASLELELPEAASPGQAVQMRVKVNNETAGHNLPSSLVEVRQMWLDVEVTDGTGDEVFRSGAVADDGTIDKDAVMFHAIAIDSNGKPTVLPWEMTRFIYYHTVPPKGYTLERYAFAVPADAKGPFSVKATLRYRVCPQAVANLLLGAGAPTIPIVDMTRTQKTLKIQQPAAGK